jgi:Uma2 family endonuclease
MTYPIPERFYTPEEYLEFERSSEEKHEWIDGRIYLMAGASPAHCGITFNLSVAIGPQLRGTNCRGFSNDMKVRSSSMKPIKGLKGLFSYPDLTIVCDEPLYHDKVRDVLINPKVIIEILSPSTEDFDRQGKFGRYQCNESLTDYILIHQDIPRVEHYQRKANNQWLLTIATGLEEELFISSINCTLLLREVYEQVTFPEEEAS